MEVGVQALRDDLFMFLAEVQKGATITVTDHGKAIARIVPAGPTALERLIAEGKVTPAKRGKGGAPDRVNASGSVSELVVEQRG